MKIAWHVTKTSFSKKNLRNSQNFLRRCQIDADKVLKVWCRYCKLFSSYIQYSGVGGNIYPQRRATFERPRLRTWICFYICEKSRYMSGRTSSSCISLMYKWFSKWFVAMACPWPAGHGDALETLISLERNDQLKSSLLCSTSPSNRFRIWSIQMPAATYHDACHGTWYVPSESVVSETPYPR